MTVRDDRRRRSGRVGFFVRRYLPPELAGTAAALAAGLAMADHGLAAAAVAASWAESLTFYTFVTVREMRRPDLADRPAVSRALVAVRETATEYGASELVDTVLLRPLLMYAFIGPLGTAAGIVAGKLVTDAGFYALAIAAYTVRRRVRGAATADLDAGTRPEFSPRAAR